MGLPSFYKYECPEVAREYAENVLDWGLMVRANLPWIPGLQFWKNFKNTVKSLELS